MILLDFSFILNIFHAESDDLQLLFFLAIVAILTASNLIRRVIMVHSEVFQMLNTYAAYRYDSFDFCVHVLYGLCGRHNSVGKHLVLA